jgi:Trypsin
MKAKTIRRAVAAAAAVVAVAAGVAVLTTSPAEAQTGGVPDGNNHPNVGLILFYDPDGRFRCSATLISPTVVITAAHCTAGTVGKTLVTFDSTIWADSTPPASSSVLFPVATNPAAGYTGTETGGSVTRAWGTAHAHPNYSNFTDLNNWNDVGVVILDSPITTITPATVAPLNYLDGYEQPNLNNTLFDLVGYGTEVRKPESGPQKPQPMSYPLIRRYTNAPGQKLTPQILQLNGNPNDTRGGGGTCFGDSGGPVFLNGLIVAVTSYGYTQNCRYLGGYQRVEIAGVQSWLADPTA